GGFNADEIEQCHLLCAARLAEQDIADVEAYLLALAIRKGAVGIGESVLAGGFIAQPLDGRPDENTGNQRGRGGNRIAATTTATGGQCDRREHRKKETKADHLNTSM